MTREGEPPNHIDPSTVKKIVSILTREDGCFVVGGQALNLYAELYAARCPALQSLFPFTSKEPDPPDVPAELCEPFPDRARDRVYVCKCG